MIFTSSSTQSISTKISASSKMIALRSGSYRFLVSYHVFFLHGASQCSIDHSLGDQFVLHIIRIRRRHEHFRGWIRIPRDNRMLLVTGHFPT